MSRRVLYVLPCKREFAGVETWRVVIDAAASDGRPVTRVNRATDFTVRAERDPDRMCDVVAVAGETSEKSAVASNRRALELAKTLACGSAVDCPGLVKCIEGAECPYGLK